ncbi:hypothetical protein ACP70R_013920 [Stipagrostis hirtigluma subsp. patula]
MAGIGRSRSRRRGEEDGSSERNVARSTVPTVDHQGAVSLRKQATDPGMLSDPLFAAENRLSKSKRANGVPMKMLIDEEFSKDVNARYTSPGVVGRLMGLDSLPYSGPRDQHRYTHRHAYKTSPSHDRSRLYEDIPHRRSADDIKDVFEVIEPTKTKMHRSSRSRNGNASSRSGKIDSSDVDFIRQKFIDAKRLSTDESLHMSEEFNETLDALVSNRDLLLEFLQKIDPVRRDVHNHGSPCSTENCITVLKPSQRSQFIGMDDSYPQGQGTEAYFTKEIKHSLRKPYSNLSSQSLKEESGPLRQKLSRSSHQENADKRAGPTRIVVLRPSLEKAHDIDGAFPLNKKIPHSNYRRQKECQDVGRWSPYTEESMYSLKNSETLDYIGKGSREIAMEITEQMREIGRCGRSRKHVVKPEPSTSISDERSQFVSSVTKLKTSEALRRPSDLYDSCASSSFSSSPTYSTETSVCKEAKKHLSNRWKKAHQRQHQVTQNDIFSTLGDMLTLSDQDAAKAATLKMARWICPKGEVQVDGMPGSRINPLGNSSNDGLRDVATSNLTRSKSLPPSFSRGVQKSNSRKRISRHNEFSMLKDVLKVGPHYSEYACRSRQRQSISRGSTFHGYESNLKSQENEERMVIEREIHVNYEEQANGVALPDTLEQTLHPAILEHDLDAVGCPDTSTVVPQKKKEPLPPARKNQQIHKQQATAFDERLLVPNLDDVVREDERIECHQGDDFPAVCGPRIESESPVGNDRHQGDENQNLGVPPSGSESPVSSNKDDHQSPVSVLESSLDAEDVYTGDFEKISSDLQELRMQLRLLKRETTDSGDDTELFILSDDEMAYQPPFDMENSHAFRDDGERDFSYVLDMLTVLGIRASNQDELLDHWYLIECPPSFDLYDKLEKKYSGLILWPEPERKLLFDITNAVLADIISSVMQCGSKGLLRRLPRWDQEGFVEMVWQRVVQLREEMEFNQQGMFLDVEWVGSEDGSYLVRSDISGILQDDLLDEIIADFLEMDGSAKLCG